jgi:hypothetical protein
MPPAYDEEKLIAAASTIGTLATHVAPDEPRVQLELILMGAVSHAIHQLKMAPEEAFRSLAWLLTELEGPDAPTLTLVP